MPRKKDVAGRFGQLMGCCLVKVELTADDEKSCKGE